MPNKRWGRGEGGRSNKTGGRGSKIFLINGGSRNFKKSVNICNESKKRHKCLVLVLNLKRSKRSKRTGSEASKNKVIIKRVSNISKN